MSSHELLKKNKNKMKVLERPIKTMDMNPMKMLWYDLKRLLKAVSVTELKLKFLTIHVKDLFPVNTRVVQRVLRFRGQILFHIGPGKFE